MKRNYSVYPSMIGGQSGIIWSYDTPTVQLPFDENHPLDVSAAKCHDLSICLWYVSPLWQFNDAAKTKYAFLGEWNKWTAVSQQRLVSIVTNTENTQTTVTLQGGPSEAIQVAVYHPSLPSAIVDCRIFQSNGQAQLVISPSTVICN
jgi:hypothetical protein